MSSDESPTIGDFFLILSEMGFTEEQIQAAVQAGHFSVPDAAEWLLQGQSPRHRLTQRSSQPAETAFSAFNPPKELTGSQASPSDSGASPPLVLKSPHSNVSPEPPQIESRIKPDKSDFEEQQRQRVTQEAREQRKQKKQERDLVLKRIAEDRKTLQAKNQTSPVSEAPRSSEGQKLGGTIQTNLENNCILMIRLPSGESMREQFQADAPLRTVVDHISGRYPSLTSFSLLQGFPRKRFGEAELACSLRSLGLTPNAALCIQTTPPETPQEQSIVNLAAAQQQNSPSAELPAAQIPDQDLNPGPAAPPLLPNRLWEEAVNYAGIPEMGHLLTGPSHSWGRGQRLVPGDVEGAPEVEGDVDLEEEREPYDMLNGMPRLPFLPENRIHGAGIDLRHHWPEQGNRLREEPPEQDEGPVAPEAAGQAAAGQAAAGQAAVERLQRAAQQNASQGQPSPPKRPFKTPSVLSLCALATRAAVSLMTAPSMQYSSSLAGLTPELAELLLEHMARERLLRPRTLELFFGCPLRRFALNCYPYSTNELLRQLRVFTALKHLSLVNSPLITDSGLTILPSLVKLQYLNLASCSKLTDACLQHITGLKSLCFLSLDQTKVTDSGMVLYLQSCPSLSQLSLNQTAVTELTLEALTSFVPQLRVLSIKQTKVSHVTSLSQMYNLQTLSLDGTGVTEASLEHLRNHPSLSSLSLTGIQVEDGNQALQIISGLKLTQLTLPGRHCVTDGGMSALSNLTLLCELDLTDYTRVTDQGVGHLSSLTRLRKLSLSNTQVTDAGLPYLQGLLELQDLCLDRTAVTSRGVADLIVHLPHLQVLGLASTHIGDNVVRRGLIRCNQLVKINLSRTRITDQSLKYLKHLRLAQVNLDGTGVTLLGIANLLSLTNIINVRASNTRVIPRDEVSDEELEIN